MGDNQAAKEAAFKKVFFKTLFCDISRKLDESELLKNAMTIAEAAATSAAKQMNVDVDVMLYRMSVELGERAAAKYIEAEGKANGE